MARKQIRFELLWFFDLFGIGSTVVVVLFLEFMISQSPDKMKGLIIGILIPSFT